jgi:hypothetical protein
MLPACCRPVAGLLPIKLLIDNDVADVADFPTRNAIHCLAENALPMIPKLHQEGDVASPTELDLFCEYNGKPSSFAGGLAKFDSSGNRRL